MLDIKILKIHDFFIFELIINGLFDWINGLINEFLMN